MTSTKPQQITVQFQPSPSLPPQVASLAEAYALLDKLVAGGALQQALSLCEQLLPQQPQAIALLWMKAYLQETLSTDMEERLAFCRRALQVDDSHIELSQMVGDLLRRLGRHREAIDWLLQCSKRLGKSWQIWLSLGQCYLEIGEGEQAVAALRKTLKCNRHVAAAWFDLIGIAAFSRSDLTQMLATRKRKGLSLREMAHLDFSIAAYWRQQGDVSRESQFLARANAAQRKERPFDSAADQQLLAEHLQHCDREYFQPIKAALGASAPADELRPIFIVGMPRCGSTLVERILSSHSDVVATGESSLVELSLSRSTARIGLVDHRPSMLPLLDEKSLQQFSSFYADQIAQTVASARYTDKSLDNHRVIGLLLSCFPGARIIDMQRHPLDIFLSCYQNAFYGVPYTNDLSAMAHYYIGYRKMMQHWQQCFDNPFIELHYEALVADPEVGIRRLCSDCGLDWQPAMLDFHHQEGAVNTVSRAQVRKKMYRDSVARWQPYRTLLQPAIEILEREGFLPELPAKSGG